METVADVLVAIWLGMLGYRVTGALFAWLRMVEAESNDRRAAATARRKTREALKQRPNG